MRIQESCGPRMVVAIPAQNEREHIAACLQALADQKSSDGRLLERGTFETILYVNNSDDDTAKIATATMASLPYALHVIDVTLHGEDASAGGARRLAMADGARRLAERGGEGILLSTDADTRVPNGWVSHIRTQIEGGIDAVAGGLILDASDEVKLPSQLKARGRLEARYEALLCELESRLNPHSWDPWPRHSQECGASFGLTLASFESIGGVPRMALGEDHALFDRLRRQGFRIRHAPEASVVTSGRLVGRAAGGCADTMRRRIEDPKARCDSRLEPAVLAIRRYRAQRTNPETAAPAAAHGVSPQALQRQIAIARCALLALKTATYLAPKPSAGSFGFHSLPPHPEAVS